MAGTNTGNIGKVGEAIIINEMHLPENKAHFFAIMNALCDKHRIADRPAQREGGG